MLTWLHHLLPKSPTWRSSASVRNLFDGVQAWFDLARDEFDLALLDFYPGTTRDVFERLVQAGISERFHGSLTATEARDLLAVLETRPLAGQGPLRLQAVLQAAGFDVFVHEWFVSGTGPAWTERDPEPYLEDALAGLMHCGDDQGTCGDDIAYCDDYVYSGGNWLTNQSILPRAKAAPPPDGYRGLFYVGGETFGDTALVDSEKKELLEYLILRYKRASQWCVLRVEFGTALLTEGGEAIVTEGGEGVFA